MKISKAFIAIEDQCTTINGNKDMIQWTDWDKNKYQMPANVLIQLYDFFKWNATHGYGMSEEEFTQHCDSLFNQVYDIPVWYTGVPEKENTDDTRC
jgi:hypothetical protein